MYMYISIFYLYSHIQEIYKESITCWDAIWTLIKLPFSGIAQRGEYRRQL